LIIKSYTLRAKVSRYLRIIILSFYIQIIMAIGKKTGGRQKGTPNKITALAKESGLVRQAVQRGCHSAG
jgi:hypothetical protein